MTQCANTLNIQPIAAPCLRHSAAEQPLTIFASHPKVILRRVAYHRDGNFPGDSRTIPDSPGHAGGKTCPIQIKMCPIQMLSTGPLCQRQPGILTPSSSTGQPGQNKSVHHPVKRRIRQRTQQRRRDPRHAASSRLPQCDGLAAGPDGAIFYDHYWRWQKGLLQDQKDIVAGFSVHQVTIRQSSGEINFNPSYFLSNY